MMDIEESSQSSETEDSSAPYQIAQDVWMVPCTIDHRSNSFLPTVRPSPEHLAEKCSSRQPWVSQEDETLRMLIVGKGTKAWTAIAQELNLHMHQGQPVRHGKQCRERWYNHLDPNLRKGNWSPSEDLIVLEKQLEVGNRWSDISKLLPGRNENSVKNRWKSMVRKAQKELPSGTDVIQWLIAERRHHESEGSDSGNVTLVSPIVCSNSPLAQFPMGMMHVPIATMSPVAFPILAVDSVKRDLRSMEQPQQFSWTPYNFQSPKDTSASPSTFLAF